MKPCPWGTGRRVKCAAPRYEHRSGAYGRGDMLTTRSGEQLGDTVRAPGRDRQGKSRAPTDALIFRSRPSSGCAVMGYRPPKGVRPPQLEGKRTGPADGGEEPRQGLRGHPGGVPAPVPRPRLPAESGGALVVPARVPVPGRGRGVPGGLGTTRRLTRPPTGSRVRHPCNSRPLARRLGELGQERVEHQQRLPVRGRHERLEQLAGSCTRRRLGQQVVAGRPHRPRHPGHQVDAGRRPGVLQPPMVPPGMAGPAAVSPRRARRAARRAARPTTPGRPPRTWRSRPAPWSARSRPAG